tara:strand:- start:71 stop:826 length:756 start_codon:yes stop_codon:yes gene_type:complete
VENQTVLEILVVVIATLCGSTVLSTLGFGIGMVATPILLLIFDPQTAIVTLSPAGTVLSALIAWRNRDHILMRETLPIALLGMAGAFTGVYVLSTSDDQLLKIAIVTLIIPLTILSFFNPTNLKDRIPFPKLVGPFIGYLVGLMLGSMAIGGPLLVIFLIVRGWKSYAIRGSMSFFLLCVMVCALIGFVPAGLYGEGRIVLSAVAFVPMIAGFWVGSRLANRMNENLFRKCSVTVIVLSSLTVIIRELPWP